MKKVNSTIVIIFSFFFVRTWLLKDKVFLQTCILPEKTCENQNKEINHPFLQLRKMTQGPAMNKECDREHDVSLYLRHACIQNFEEMWIK